jgi:hypothetical protein
VDREYGERRVTKDAWSLRARGEPKAENFPIPPPGKYRLHSEIILIIPYDRIDKPISDEVLEVADVVIYGDGLKWKVWKDRHGVLSGITEVKLSIFH